MDATNTLLLDHVPPVVESINIAVVLAQIEDGPEMGNTCAIEVSEVITARKARVKSFFIKINLWLKIAWFLIG
jgi:uncharacterized membrane protein